MARASATPPNSMYYLSKEELELLKVNWRPKTYQAKSVPSDLRKSRGTLSARQNTTAVLVLSFDLVNAITPRPRRP
jgi:hypothetical protein